MVKLVPLPLWWGLYFLSPAEAVCSLLRMLVKLHFPSITTRWCSDFVYYFSTGWCVGLCVCGSLCVPVSMCVVYKSACESSWYISILSEFQHFCKLAHLFTLFPICVKSETGTVWELDILLFKIGWFML